MERSIQERIAEKSIPQAGGCVVFPEGSRFPSGYAHIWYKGGTRRASRVVWELHHGPIPDGEMVRHKCDNPPCVNIEHLEIGTHAENMADRDVRNRTAKGSGNGYARLTEGQIPLIRRRLAARESSYSIAESFNVSQSTIQLIRAGKRWAHVPHEPGVVVNPNPGYRKAS